MVFFINICSMIEYAAKRRTYILHNFERICEIMNEVAGVAREQVTPESTVDQLNLDSLDVTELILSIEDEFGILVEDDSEIRCVNDLLVRLDKIA